jgi:nitrate reductase delta subunit
MHQTLKALAALLTYPDPELRSALPEIVAAIREEGALPRANITALAGLAEEISGRDPLVAEEAYVSLFDRGKSTSLNLFEHLHGESRDRGSAMVDLKLTYERAGFRLSAKQLPDYLPVLLEFLSARPAKEAREMLVDCAHIVRSIGEAVRDRGSRYHAVPAAVLALAGEAGLGKPRPAPVETAKSLDEEWAESEVVFGPAANPCASARPPVSVVRVVPRDASRSLP